MRSYSKLIIVVLLCLISISIIGIPAYASNFKLHITPSRFEILTDPGRTSYHSIQLTNHGQKPLDLKVGALDWDLDENQKLILKEPQSLKNSASNWFRFNPRNFSIESGQDQILRFSVTPPPNAKPGEYRTCLYLYTDQTFTMENGVSFTPTFVVVMYINIPDIRRQGELGDLSLLESEEGLYLEGQIYSTGNAHIRLAGNYTIKDEKGTVIAEDKLSQKVVLTGGKQKYCIPLGKDLNSGDYKITINWDYIPAFYMKGELNEYSDNQRGLDKEFSFTIE